MLLLELEGVDGAYATAAGVCPTAYGAAEPNEPVLPRSVDHEITRRGHRISVGDGCEVVHHFHGLGGRAEVVALDFGLLARHQTGDVSDVADPLALPPRRHSHAVGQGPRRASIDGVEQRR